MATSGPDECARTRGPQPADRSIVARGKSHITADRAARRDNRDRDGQTDADGPRTAHGTHDTLSNATRTREWNAKKKRDATRRIHTAEKKKEAPITRSCLPLGEPFCRSFTWPANNALFKMTANRNTRDVIVAAVTNGGNDGLQSYPCRIYRRDARPQGNGDRPSPADVRQPFFARSIAKLAIPCRAARTSHDVPALLP